MNCGFGAFDEIGFHFVAGQLENLDAAGVVSAVPLDIDVAGGIGALAECGGVFVAGVFGNYADRSELRRGASVFQEDGASAGRHDDGFADEANIARADKVILPVDAVLAVFEPGFAAPAIAIELHNILYEVPGPDLGAI